jgi:hypothetical protein
MERTAVTNDEKLHSILQFVGRQVLSLMVNADVNHSQSFSGSATGEHNFDKQGRLNQFKFIVTVNLSDEMPNEDETG